MTTTSVTVPECPICGERYGGPVMPHILTCCKNDVCFDCAERDRSVQVSELTGNRKRIKCMYCRELYHSTNETPWIMNKPLIENLGIRVVDFRVTAPRRSSSSLRNDSRTTTTSTRTRTETNGHEANDSLREEEVPTVEVPTEQQHHDEEEQPSEPNTQTRRRERDMEEQEAPTTVRNSTRRTRTRTRESYVTIIHEEIPRHSEMEHTSTGITNDNVFFQNAQHMFRIRQFTQDSKQTGVDPFGTGPSMWCVQNNYCASSDRILASNDIYDPEEARRFLLDSDKERLATSCIGKRLFVNHENHIKTYTNSYKRFASMSMGDIVAMIVPGPPHQSEAYFGVITSNDLKLMTPQEAEEANFPAMHLFQDNALRNPRFNGLMLREVKWLRKAFMRDLPEQKRSNFSDPRRTVSYTVPWLAESAPFWLCEISDHVNRIKTQSFLESTSPIL